MDKNSGPKPFQAQYVGNKELGTGVLQSIITERSKIIDRTHNEVRQLREKEALAIATIKKRARKRGERNGLTAAKVKMQVQFLKLHQLYLDTIRRANHDCFNLALDVSEKVLGNILPKNTKALSTRIRNALNDLVEQSTIIITVNPKCEKQIREELQDLPFAYAVKCCDSIPAGNAQVKTLSGLIELDWQEHLKALKKSMLNKLEEKLIYEERKTHVASS